MEEGEGGVQNYYQFSGVTNGMHGVIGRGYTERRATLRGEILNSSGLKMSVGLPGVIISSRQFGGKGGIQNIAV